MAGRNSLVNAFPSKVSTPVVHILALIPNQTTYSENVPISVRVCGEDLVIPYRISIGRGYLPNHFLLSPLQQELLQCLYTRNPNGYIREAGLRKIIGSRNEWIPPYVLRLLGEYVIEILDVIYKKLDILDEGLYREFLRNNPVFWKRMKDLVTNYWAEYYRNHYRDAYVGARIVAHFEALLEQE